MNIRTLSNKTKKYNHYKKLRTRKFFYLNQKRLLENIIECKNSKDLITSLSEEVLYFITRSSSLNNYLYILSQASVTQLEYFFDMEIWEKNKIDYESSSILITTMIIANQEKFLQWLFYKKIDMLEIYLHKFLNIKILKNEEDKFYLDKQYFTNDGIFYFNFKNKINKTNRNSSTLGIRDKAIKNLLFKLSNIDLIRYQNILLESSSIISTEIEEKLLTNRKTRLLEKGFPQYEKSINIYKNCNLKKIKRTKIKILNKSLEKNLNFNKILDKFYKYKNIKITNNNLRNEFYFICNKSIIANKKEINSLDYLNKIISKVNNHTLLGIQILSKYKFNSTSNLKKIKIIKEYSLNDIFKIFISRILTTKKVTDKWYVKSWLKKNQINIILWSKISDLTLKTIILEKSTRVISNKLEFKNLNYVKKIEKKLQLIFDLDKLFSKLKISSYFLKKNNKLNYKNLLLNIWILNSMYFYKNKNISNTKKTILRNFYKKSLINTKKNKKYFLFWISNKLKIKKSIIPKTLKQFTNKIFDTT